MNPSTSIVAINRIIQVGTAVQGVPSAQRDFKNCVFVWKGTQKGDNRINYVGTDTDYITTLYGSNSEAFKAATSYLAGGFNGNTPQQLYIANIDADITLEITSGQLTYVADGNYFTYSGADATVQALFASKGAVFAKLSVQDAEVYLTLDSENHVQAFLTKGDVIENNPIVLSGAPYSITDGNATTTATLSVDNFADALAEILNASTCYLVGLDNTFSEDQKKLAMALVESTTPSHFLSILDTSNDAAYVTSETSTLAGYNKAHAYQKTAVVVDDADKANEYKQMSLLSYYGQVNMTAASPMGSVMFKSMSGITASEFKNGGVISATTAWDNITGKNANCYTKFTEVYDDCWAKGTTGSGHQIGDIIAADYVDYRVTYELFYMLRSVPKLPVNAGGASRIEQCMATAFRRLADAGVIGAGVATDGETFGGDGFKVYAEVPTGNDKILGVWTNVTGVGLLTGTTTKVIVQNTLKY